MNALKRIMLEAALVFLFTLIGREAVGVARVVAENYRSRPGVTEL